MATVVIAGGGLAGVPLAHELRDLLSSDHRVILINPRDAWRFVPSNPWIVVGWRRPDAISVPLAAPLARHGIEFVPATLAHVDPQACRVTLENGNAFHYDHLVIATGPHPDFAAIPGLGPDHYSHSILDLSDACRAREAWSRLADAPGDIVIGAVQGASCLGPAYEFAFIIDRDLRERHRRDKGRITFITAEPWIGHLGYGGIASSRELLEEELKGHGIHAMSNVQVTRVWRHHVDIKLWQDDHWHVATLHSNFTMLMPAFRGVPALRDVPGLVDERGFVRVDAYLRSTAHINIWAVGHAAAIDPVIHRPTHDGHPWVNTPQGGYMIESMVTATAENIRLAIEGAAPTHETIHNAIYLADRGIDGLAFVALPQERPRHLDSICRGIHVHEAKVAFERHMLEKIRQGGRAHVYEQWVRSTLDQALCQ